MNYNKYKWFISIFIVKLIALIGIINYGFYQMDKEDRYGDFYYLLDEVQDGDILVYSTYDNKNEFKNFGVVNRSFFNIKIYDYQNTIPKTAYDWYDDHSIYRVKLYRPKKLNSSYFHLNEIQDSDQFDLIHQTY